MSEERDDPRIARAEEDRAWLDSERDTGWQVAQSRWERQHEAGRGGA